MEQSKDILTIINMIDIIKEKIKDIELHLQKKIFFDNIFIIFL